MTDESRDPSLESLIEGFFAARRRGEAPSVDSYVERYPGQAEELRELLEAMQLLDGVSGEGAGRVSDEDFVAQVLARLREHAPGRAYELQGELARGGQGVVFSVWDPELRRRLAMKVSHVSPAAGGAEASPLVPEATKSLGRFLEEAQVTARLDHPGIAPVHELGLDSKGRVFFTMKLVKGRDLREVFELVAKGDPGWSRTRVLGLLLKVCETMEYAHARGVIHRDLKPANVMVGRYGEVLVMDWGLARFLEREDRKDVRIRDPGSADDRSEDGGSDLRTMEGDVIGTPSYMAPEQARGELDRVGPRSDVYSLGAMLYHVLAGQAPYGRADGRLNGHQVLAQVVAGPPPSLVEHAPDAPQELVAICEKAMAREPKERFSSVAALGDDLRAFLENRVVAAHEAGPLAELRKWVRRNRSPATAAAVAVLALIVGLATSLNFAARAKANARVAEANEAEASGQGERTRRMNEFLAGMLGATNYDEVGRRLDVEEVLRRGLAGIESTFEGELDLEAEARRLIGLSFASMSQLLEGIEELEKAAAILRSTLGPDDVDTLRAQHELGVVLARAGFHSRARDLLQDVLDRRSNVLGEAHPATLETMSKLVHSEQQLHDFEAAEEHGRRALELAEAELGPEDETTINLLRFVSRIESKIGNHEEADRLRQEAARRAEAAFGPDGLLTLKTRREAVAAGFEEGKPVSPEAVAELRRLIERRELKFGSDDFYVSYWRGSLGNILHRQGSREEGLRLMDEGLEGFERILGEQNHWTAVALYYRANAAWEGGQKEEALVLHERSLEIRIRVLGADNPQTLNSRGVVGWTHHLMGDSESAEIMLRESLAGLRRVLRPDHVFITYGALRLGQFLLTNERLDEARPLVVEVVERSVPTLGWDHGWTQQHVNRLANLARRFAEEGRSDVAIELLESLAEQVVGIDSAHLYVGDWSLLGTLHALYLETGNRAEAQGIATERLRILFEQASREEATAWEANQYAWALLEIQPETLRDPGQALLFAERANEQSSHSDPNLLDTLALALFRTGEPQRAVEVQERVLELTPSDHESRAEFEARLQQFREALLQGREPVGDDD